MVLNGAGMHIVEKINAGMQDPRNAFFLFIILCIWAIKFLILDKVESIPCFFKDIELCTTLAASELKV
jgi:hypothetical protein